MTRRRRRRRDGTLLYGMAAGMFLTLLITAGLDVASRRGVTLQASLLNPVSARGTIAPAAQPDGAIRVPDAVTRITVDGAAARANTGGLVTVGPGRHRVEMENAAGDVWVTSVAVAAGSTVAVEPRWSAELIVDAEDWPESASLTLDGASCAPPPFVLDDLPAGEHHVAMTDGGTVRWEESVVVSAGASRRVVIPAVVLPQAVPAAVDSAAPAPAPAPDSSALTGDAPAWIASIEPQLP